MAGISVYIGARNATIAAVAALAVGIAAVPVITGDSGSGSCTTTFTAAGQDNSPYNGDNVNTALQSAASNAVFCFAAGTYNGLDLYNADPSTRITMRPVSAATVDMGAITMNGVSNVTFQDFEGASTIDGILMQDAGEGPTYDITVQDNNMPESGVKVLNNARATLGIVIQRNEFVGYTTATDDGDRVKFFNNDTCSGGTNITFQDNLLQGGKADGITMTANCKVIIQRNEFADIIDPNCGGIHCDAIQTGNTGSSDSDVQILNNYLHNVQTGIMAYDGGGTGIVISGNVLQGVPGNSGNGNAINMGGTSGPTITHNTLTGNTYINLGSKAGQQTTNAIVRDNIAPDGVQSQGVGTAASYAADSPNYNMCSTSSSTCAGANSLTTRVAGTHYSFAGGATPTSRAGFALTGGSAGENVASDGTDIGANP